VRTATHNKPPRRHSFLCHHSDTRLLGASGDRGRLAPCRARLQTKGARPPQVPSPFRLWAADRCRRPLLRRSSKPISQWIGSKLASCSPRCRKD